MKRILAVVLLLAAIPAAAARLPRTFTPVHYDLTIVPDFAADSFKGEVSIGGSVEQPSREITLHAVEMQVEHATIRSGDTEQTAAVKFNAGDETATLTVDKPLTVGPASIQMTFSAKLNKELRGLYVGHAGTRKYAATQLESTDARRMYPSFDEPELKATFAIRAVVDDGDTAISNGPVASDVPGPGTGKHTITFATTPRISTYLVALVVGRFECLSDSVDGIPLRICGSPEKAALGAYAMGATKEILHYFNGYFTMKYPFAKLDQIGIPDFAAGAMENPGAIIYRETSLLADEKTASIEAKQRIAGTISHEIAHMWFGDLVTMQWWNDVWLNEGFATWITSKPIVQWKPSWNPALADVAETGEAVGEDAQPITRAIRTRAETPDEIEALFDGIAYAKTAAVLRMIESYMGPRLFAKGVNDYIALHAYDNATAGDFSDALSALNPSVEPILESFVNQGGIPLVSVASRCEGDKTVVDLTQERFRSVPATGTSLWQIPVCFDVAGSDATRCELLTEPEQTVTLDGCHSPVFANANGFGYYLTSYSPSDSAAIRNALPQRDPAERLVLARDEWYLVRAGRKNIGDYLDLASSYRSEREFLVFGQILQNLGYINSRVATDQNRIAYRKWLASYVRPIANELGWSPAPNESDSKKQLRAAVLGALAGTARDPEAAAQARKLVDAYMNGTGTLDPSLVETMLRVAAVNGDEKLYDSYARAARKASTPEASKQYLYALSAFSQAKLVTRTVEMTLGPDVRLQDSGRLIWGLMGNPESATQAWQTLKKNWTKIGEKSTTRAYPYLARATGALCSPEAIADVKAFFAQHPLGEGSPMLTQALGEMENCVAFRQAQEPSLAKWLDNNAK